jgi:hypothetical protein
MSQYTVSVNNNEFLINTVVQDLNLSLSRTGGQGSSGNSVSDAYFDSNDNLIIEVSNAAGGVVQTINLGPVAAVNATSISETCKNVSGGTLAIGTPVYQSGTAGQAMEVQAARADTAASMPAVGVLTSTLADEAEGSLVLTGFVKGFDTSAFSEGDTLYIGATGGLTTTAPPGSGNLIQNIGKVIKVHASNGSIMVTGAGRANDTPNLDDGDIFIGNASNLATTASLETEVQAIGDSRYVGVAGGTADNVIIGGTTAAAGNFTTLGATGDIAVGGTVDGRDLATDGTKLDGIEALADVTDTVNVTAAGALMDSELTDITAIKALNQGVATTDSPVFVGVTTTALDVTGAITSDGLTVDTDTLHVDATNNFVGIGTSSPAEELHIYSDNSPVVLIEAAADNDSRLRLLTPNDGIGFIEFGDTGDSDTGEIRYEHSTNNMVFSTNGTQEAMRIDSNGKVGIGTDSPEATLTVDGQTILGDGVAGSANLTNLTSGTPPQLIAGFSVPAITWSPSSSTEAVFTRDGPMQIDILAGANNFSNINFSDPDDEDVGQLSYDHSTDAMRFRTDNSERMRIDSNGNVGVGTSSPSEQLSATANISATNFYVTSNGDTSAAGISGGFRHGGINSKSLIIEADPGDTGANTAMRFEVDGAEALRIDSNGNVGIGTDSPAGVLQISATFPTFTLDETNTDAAYQQTQFSLDNGSFRIQTRTSTNAYVSNDYLIDKDANGATAHGWRIGNVEAMRIDSSSNLDMNGNDIIDVEDIRTSSGTKVFFPRAWVNFNGTGTVAIRDSGNVSSITDLGVGEFRINFTNPYSNASYAASASSASTVASSDTFANAYSYATSSVTVGVNAVTGTLVDRTYQTVTTVGNQ